MSADAQVMVAAAARLGDRLVREAVWHEGRCTWLGAVMEPVGGEWQLVHRSCPGDLYEGTSGIALFLAWLSDRTQDPRHRDTALGAARHALDWIERSGTSDGSLYGGAAGVAWAATSVATSTDDDRLRAAASAAADRAAAATAANLVGHDLMSGSAGAVVALVDLARASDRPEYLAAAERLGDALVAEAHDDGVGLSWPAGPEPGLCGLGHGAAGAALALVELHAATGEQRWRDAARAAERYERGWFDRTQLNWPDLRGVVRAAAAPQPAYSCFWCHGAVGVGLARLRSHQVDGDTTALADAGAALQAAAWAVRIAETTAGFGSNPSVCHGLAGLADLFAFAGVALRQPAHRELAERIGARLADIADGTVEVWPSGVVGGGQSPGLMLGWAGVGAVLLRVAGTGSVHPVGLPCTAPHG